MNHQLFDLDRALDDFEHEELDKLAATCSQPLFAVKPMQYLHRNSSPSRVSGKEDSGAAILDLLGSSVNNPNSQCAEISDEYNKDHCGENFSACQSQSSSDRTSHIASEEQSSSSNMDSGLCSSSEFASLDNGDFSSHALLQVDTTGDTKTLLNNVQAAYIANEDAIMDSQQHCSSSMNGSDFFPRTSIHTSKNETGPAAVENDNYLQTPTVTSPSQPFALTPMGDPSNHGALRRHSDAPPLVGSENCTQLTPTRPNLLDFSVSCGAEIMTRNVGSETFFISDQRNSLVDSTFRSLPVVGSSSETNAGANKLSSSSCRRPSSLLLSEKAPGSSVSGHAPRPSGGTKRPSSLFGLPCIASDTNMTSSTSNDTLQRKNSPPPKTDKKQYTSVEAKPIGNDSSVIQAANITNLMDLPEIPSSITPTPTVASASGRRSPSTCSACSEILQLPAPAIPSSTSSCSPDSASLSRSSICDGMPSPMTQAQSSILGTVGTPPADGNTVNTLMASDDIPGHNIPSSMEEDVETLNAPEEATGVSSGHTESSLDLSRVLPCGDSLGRQAPAWVPDADALGCSGCGSRFTFTKRRHHCRACGKIYCNSCCSLRYQLEFLNAVARVCIICYPELVRLEARRNNAEPGPPIAAPSALRNLKARLPSNSPQNTTGSASGVMTNSSNVAGSVPATRRNKKKVVFSDGIRPGEHAIPQASSGAAGTMLSPANETYSSADASPMIESSEPASTASSTVQLIPIRIKTNFAWPENQATILQEGLQGMENNWESISIMLNARLAAKVQRVDLAACCCNTTNQCAAPFFAVVSIGLSAATEYEVMVVLRTYALSSYLGVVMKLFERLWSDSEQGRFYDEFASILIDNVGFVIVRPSFQCTQNLPIPRYSRWVSATVITDPNEISWARLFPPRLLLRLGHESGHYPIPLVSDLTRAPLFHQPGHTVLSLFSDFRTYLYRLENTEGAILHLDRACGKQSAQQSPQQGEATVGINRRHILLLPITAASGIRLLAENGNEHVIAIGASFSPTADGHLVAVQSPPPEVAYRTEAITMLGGAAGSEEIRTVAGSFIIFNGSLRPDSNGVARARLTVLEDGCMVQMTANQMTELRAALSKRQNFTLQCVTANTVENEDSKSCHAPADSFAIEWIQSSLEISSQWSRPQSALRCRLPIGFHNTMMASLIQSATVNCEASIRVAAVFSWPLDHSAQATWCSRSLYANASLAQQNSGQNQHPTDPTISQAFVTALVLDKASLAFASSTQLALSQFADKLFTQPAGEYPVQVIVRIRLDLDSLGFEAGMSSHYGDDNLNLPEQCVEALDSELVPTLFNVAQALGSKLPPGGLCFDVVVFSVPPVSVAEPFQVTDSKILMDDNVN